MHLSWRRKCYGPGPGRGSPARSHLSLQALIQIDGALNTKSCFSVCGWQDVASRSAARCFPPLFPLSPHPSRSEWSAFSPPWRVDMPEISLLRCLCSWKYFPALSPLHERDTFICQLIGGISNNLWQRYKSQSCCKYLKPISTHDVSLSHSAPVA